MQEQQRNRESQKCCLLVKYYHQKHNFLQYRPNKLQCVVVLFKKQKDLKTSRFLNHQMLALLAVGGPQAEP